MATFSDYYQGGAFPPDLFGAPTQTFQQDFFSANPDVGYRSFLNQTGAGGLDPFGTFAQQQYGRQYQTFQSQLPGLPVNTSFTDWLGTNGLPSLQTQWKGLAPQQRNENVGMFGGRLRWL